MNWFIYIGGWLLGYPVINTVFTTTDSEIMLTIWKLTTWTCIWVWICWKFIK